MEKAYLILSKSHFLSIQTQWVPCPHDLLLPDREKIIGPIVVERLQHYLHRLETIAELYDESRAWHPALRPMHILEVHRRGLMVIEKVRYSDFESFAKEMKEAMQYAALAQ